MSEPLLTVLDRMRTHLLDPDALVRAVASGRRKGQQPPWRRVELRYVDLKAGRHLQVTAYDETQAHTSNHLVGDAARDAVADLLEQPFGNWHVDTTTELHQVRVTKKGEAMLHSKPRPTEVEAERGHDRDKQRLLPEDDPVLVALGISDQQGRVKPSRQAKYRQVEEF
ncbi:SAM-dependent methyltransferase, partial [Nocardioides aestuarii]